MSFLSYIYPQTILISSSKYNKLIRVNEENGKLKLLVNGSRQSGAYIEKLWRAAFKKFSIVKANKILVLGVGGGTVIELLKLADITAVDIDKRMISIAKKYFGIEAKFIQADARDFVKKKGKYDLIIIDLFIGNQIPEFVTSREFLRDVQKLGGTVVINYLWDREYKKKSDELEKTLKRVFDRVEDFKIEANRFFLADNDRER